MLENGTERGERRAGASVVRGLVACLLASAAACRGGEPERLRSHVQAADGTEAEPVVQHVGPAVHVDDSGPARFAATIAEGFDVERALETVRFADRYYRAPAGPGYDATLDHVIERLRAAGFGGDDPRFELRVATTTLETPAWVPRGASLTLFVPGGEPRTLHAFDEISDAERTMLPVGTPPAEVRGRVALSLGDLEEGMILATEVAAWQVLARAEAHGAAAVVSASLEVFNVDPTGADRHLDAIQYRVLGPDPELPVCQISPRSFEAIRRAVEADPATELVYRADVELANRPLRTLVAGVVGDVEPDDVVAIVSHAQEPGAGDNATGVAGLLEGAVALAELLRSGAIDWPARSLAFVWGHEFEMSRVFLETTPRRCVAAFSSDMTGQSPEKTGARALLERMPDPGAVLPLAPDEHTPWGAGEVDATELVPNGLAVIARCAMVDVGAGVGGWETADHPWEGGSDHDVFIERGIPAALFWHFTDFTYHTSLDRLPFVDGEELERTTTALFASTLAVADPEPGDLDRYLKSLELERALRVRVAEAEGHPEIAEAWNEWCEGAREWLRAECMRLSEDADR